MSTSIKDRVNAEYSGLIDSFTNLIRAARVAEEHVDLSRAQVPKVPGELMEVFVEKMLQNGGNIISLIAELKRNALLNDFATRNKEVAAACSSHQEALEKFQSQHAELQSRITQDQQRNFERSSAALHPSS